MSAIDPRIMLDAYTQGLFPMADPAHPGEIGWYRPDPRAILELDQMRLSSSLKRAVRSDRFQIRTDTCFDEVIRACAEPAPGREETWIDQSIISTYAELHRLGFAHSIEAFHEDQLVGGLYGVHIQAAFMGESMFSRPHLGGTDASKVCLVWLVDQLRTIGCTLLDVQWTTPHLERLGVHEISDDQYRMRLAAATGQATVWGPLRSSGTAVLEAIETGHQ
ncbi:MAG: leucyl/phenylalanyl-tRNA--protein transferase [Phycisphaerales bacterium]|nr:leucyl/phenylalanyl-tRNA--protein transferase [Phycisphaerales bacterium]